MITTSQFLGAVSHVGLPYLRWVTTSETFVAPFSGLYKFAVFGAGGSGAQVRTHPTYSYNFVAQGGASGGFSIKYAELSAGDNVVITLGTGGTIIYGSQGVIHSGSYIIHGGVQGGTTTVVGPGIDIEITGGEGGKAHNHQYTGGSMTVAPLGGVATGGDINRNGTQPYAYANNAQGVNRYGGSGICPIVEVDLWEFPASGTLYGPAIINSNDDGTVLARNSGIMSQLSIAFGQSFVYGPYFSASENPFSKQSYQYNTSGTSGSINTPAPGFFCATHNISATGSNTECRSQRSSYAAGGGVIASNDLTTNAGGSVYYPHGGNAMVTIEGVRI